MLLTRLALVVAVCSVIAGCGGGAPRHAQPTPVPTVIAPAAIATPAPVAPDGIAVDSSGRHIARWVEDRHGPGYRLELDGRLQSLVVDPNDLDIPPDLGTETDGHTVLVYTHAHSVREFDPRTGASRALASGSAPSISHGRLAYVRGGELVFRAVDGTETHAPIPGGLVHRQVTALKLAGSVYAVVVTDHYAADDPTGYKELWFGRLGRSPRELLKGIDSTMQAAAFTQPIITPRWVIIGTSRQGDPGTSAQIDRVSPSLDVAQAFRLGTDYRDEDRPQTLTSIAARAGGFDVVWADDGGTQSPDRIDTRRWTPHVVPYGPFRQQRRRR